jgi:fatty acid desaturase
MNASTAAAAELSPKPWLEAFTREEIRELLAVRDLRGWASVAINWILIGAAFALVALSPNLLTVVFALFVIGARQLGLAVLMHEAAHRTLLSDRRWNDWVGNWLCAYPIWNDTQPYRRYHLEHHAKTWTPEDPDLGLATPFPVSRASLRRKIWRDLSGQTGWKRLVATLKRDLGKTRGRARRNAGDAGAKSLVGVIVTNALLLGGLAIWGHPALYLLWAAAWITTYSLVMRIRSIAEHAMVPEPADPLRNTRTTQARWWERLLIAPNRVNFHLEHHLLMTVPHYNLPRMHRRLRERGLLGSACVARGYREVLELASSAAADGPKQERVLPARPEGF